MFRTSSSSPWEGLGEGPEQDKEGNRILYKYFVPTGRGLNQIQLSAIRDGQNKRATMCRVDVRDSSAAWDRRSHFRCSCNTDTPDSNPNAC